MRTRERAKAAAWILAAAVLITDLGGNSISAYAVQSKTEHTLTQGNENNIIQKRAVSTDTGQEDRESQADLPEQEAERAFAALLRDYDMYGVLTNTENISVMQNASQDSAVVRVLPSGYQVRFFGRRSEGRGNLV